MREWGASKATVGGRDGSVIRGERWSGEEEDSAGTPTRLLAREGEATRNGRTGDKSARAWVGAREKGANVRPVSGWDRGAGWLTRWADGRRADVDLLVLLLGLAGAAAATRPNGFFVRPASVGFSLSHR